MANDQIKNIIAPAAIEVGSNHLRLSNKLTKTLFVFSYPRYLATGWFSPIVNFPGLLDVSIFMVPIETPMALKKLRRKATQIEAQLIDQEEKGMIRNPMLETAHQDVENLRDSLQQSREHLFHVGAYITIYADNEKELKQLEGDITNILESRLIYAKPALFQQMEGFATTLPIGEDKLSVNTPLNSGPLSSFFPFVSLNLTAEQGILYGINRHNNSLIIFDRFELENANMVIFAKSGAGKSYAAKLEILRLLMTGTDILVVDPENEYERLTRAVGGSYFRISLTSNDHINPFQIPVIPKGEDPAEVLRSHIVNLAGLLRLMVGKISPEEEALIDRAITETYASRDIVPGKDFSKKEPPVLKDLENVLRNFEGGQSLGERLYRFTEGSFAGFANQATNIDIKNRLIVFSLRDLEEELRPIAMYVILNFIWAVIRSELKRRVVVVDEAWLLMKNQDSATFLFGLVKRARKYYLGVTTITQDVEDFLLSPYGRPIITNSSLQLLLRQSPAMIDTIAKTFDLSQGERSLLLEGDVGQGLFFAGLNHVAIQVIASYPEDRLITTNPEEILNQELLDEE
ncbi:MAG: ATP-binding protein [bacterium]|nr:ATP-binding protein [bacterium]